MELKNLFRLFQNSHLTKLNVDNDENNYVYNNETDEFEIRIDKDHGLIRQIVAAVIKLDTEVENLSMAPSDRRRMYGIREKFIAHLRKLGANTLADNL